MSRPQRKQWNTTRTLGNTVRVQLADGSTQEAYVKRIGEPTVGRDGKLWCMVTAKLADFRSVYFATIYEAA